MSKQIIQCFCFRHEVMNHGLKMAVYIEDERDEFGYYYCQFHDCGLVFSTKQTRQRYDWTMQMLPFCMYI